MLDYLDKLRAKPVHVRQRIALATTLSLSLLIGSIAWSTWNNGGAMVPSFAETSNRSPLSFVSDMFTHTKKEMTAAIVDVSAQLQHATEGSVNYTPEAETPTTSGSVSATEQATMDDAISPDILGDQTVSATSETIQTRPRTFEHTDAGTVAADNMIQ